VLMGFEVGICFESTILRRRGWGGLRLNDDASRE
jgi:hypothetical protein